MRIGRKDCDRSLSSTLASFNSRFLRREDLIRDIFTRQIRYRFRHRKRYDVVSTDSCSVSGISCQPWQIEDICSSCSLPRSSSSRTSDRYWSLTVSSTLQNESILQMASAIAAPFKMGSKKTYLPTSIYTLVRGSGKLPPNQAMFHVPLNTNKFDVRDYLYNLYGLVTTNVKVMIQQGELQRGTTYERSRNKHFKKALPMTRPASSKRVIVTMDTPFKYPDPPTSEKDLEPWNIKIAQQMRERALRGRRGLTRAKGTNRFAVNGRAGY